MAQDEVGRNLIHIVIHIVEAITHLCNVFAFCVQTGTFCTVRNQEKEEIVVDETPKPANPNTDETDYEAIKRQIAEYQQKIRELEKLLPKK